MFSLGSFSAFPSVDDLVSRKRLVVERNELKNDFVGKCLVYAGYTCLLSVQSQFGIILCIYDFDGFVSMKRQILEQNGANFRLQWYVFIVHGVVLRKRLVIKLNKRCYRDCKVSG